MVSFPLEDCILLSNFRYKNFGSDLHKDWQIGSVKAINQRVYSIFYRLQICLKTVKFIFDIA